MKTKYRKFDLEERFIQFGIKIIRPVEKLPNSIAGNTLGKLLVRSGTSPVLN